jgi:hypothetical protein
MREPSSSSVIDVQDWVVSSLKYKGRRAEAAKVVTANVLDWWFTKPELYRMEDKPVALAECRAYVKASHSRYGSWVASFILTILLNLVAKAVTELLIDWLFSSDPEKSQ